MLACLPSESVNEKVLIAFSNNRKNGKREKYDHKPCSEENGGKAGKNCNAKAHF